MRRHRQFDGLVTLEIVAPPEDIDRIVAAVDAYAEHLRAGAKAPAGAATGAAEQPVSDSGAGDEAPAGAAEAPRSWAQRRVDALTDLVEDGLAHAIAGRDVEVDRAVISVGVDYDTLVERAPGPATLGAGGPLTGEAARRLACDAGLVRIITRGRSEVLDVGRKTRQWPRAVRRAILFRHDNRCGAPGCARRIVQLHHLVDWTKGGETAVDVGVPLCAGHHRMVHDHGWTVRYDLLTGITRFTGPDGQVMETPSRTTLPIAA
jgi:hypothetical protein